MTDYSPQHFILATNGNTPKFKDYEYSGAGTTEANTYATMPAVSYRRARASNNASSVEHLDSSNNSNMKSINYRLLIN